MQQATQPNYAEEMKHSLYFGLIFGAIAGAGLAFYQSWFSGHFIQKGLTFFVLEIVSTSILQASAGAFVVFLVIFPVLSFVARIFHIRNLKSARLAAILAGALWLIAGYKLNKTVWYPPILSLKGITANLVLSLGCLGAAVGFYKIFIATLFRQGDSPSVLLRKMYNKFVFAAVALFFLAFHTVAYYRVSAQKPAGPNLLFITIDTLRADRLGSYGHSANTSPSIDKLAEQGTRFEHVYAQRGLTWPSLTSIMTSLYPKTHGVLKNQWPLDGQFITLAEILKNAGYKTGAFLANFYYAPNRGFDVKKGGEVGDLDKTVTRDALDWLKGIEPKQDKFFMWVHYKNPHDPYTPPQRYIELFDSTYTGPFDGSRPVLDSIYVHKVELGDRDLSYINSLYDAEIRATDTSIDRLLKRLDEMGLTDNTLIVFSADHGEELYEHNFYFFHSCSMYEGVLRIPLIMKLPGVIPAGKVVHSQVESIDIIPTMLQLLKVPLRDEFEGSSALPFIFEETNGVSRLAFAERAGSIFSIRTPEWRYIYNPDDYHTYCSRSDDDSGDGYIIAAEELYDVRSDPFEQNNLVAEYPDIARELRGRIIEWVNTNKREHKEHELTKEAEERLRALGYIK
ncbi:MAG: sulfatase [bacterium]